MRTKPKRQVHFIAQDEGSVRALLPVYLSSRSWPDVKPRFYAVKYGLAFLRRHRKSCREFPSAGRYPAGDHPPDLIITGASMRRSAEKEAIAYARAQGIASLTILDHGSHYWGRFSAAGKHDLSVLPDMILAPDLQSRDEMVRLGFPRGRIRVTGNPAFDGMRSVGMSGNGPPTILCVMQPSYVGGHYRRDAAWLPLLRRLAEEFSPPLVIIIRPHPKESARGYRRIGERGVRVDDRSDISELIAGSDVVIGKNSTALIEAALRGKTVISYNPGGVGFERLPTDRFGLSAFARNENDLLDQVREALQPGGVPRRLRRIRFYNDGRNGERAERLIRGMLGRIRGKRKIKRTSSSGGRHV